MEFREALAAERNSQATAKRLQITSTMFSRSKT